MTIEKADGDLTPEANPFIDALGPYINAAEWASKLARDPLHTIDMKAVSEERRDELLDDIRYRIEPIRETIRIAQTLQKMMRRSYRRKNPLDPKERVKKNIFLGVNTTQDLELVNSESMSPASALIIKGCTGLGKSTSVMRFCELIPQKIIHGANVGAGWIEQIQIPYLIVPMPVHKGSFLYAILAALDAVLGKNFAEKYRGWSIEKLEIKVGVLLITYNVGMLIIEELQPRNFGESPYLNQFLLMLLRLLNFGIPIIFIGNPLAFDGIDDHSQDLRRLHSEDSVELMPLHVEDPDWYEGLAPGLWAHNCMPQQTLCTSEIVVTLHKASAGIPHFASNAVVGAQRIALRRGERKVSVRHIEQYMSESSAYASCRDLIEGFQARDPWRLSRYLDVPWERYGLMWGATADDLLKVSKNPDLSDSFESMDPDDMFGLKSVHEKFRKNLLREQARNKTKAYRDEVARKKSQEEVDPTDMASTLGKSLDALRSEIDKNVSKR